MGFKTNFRSYTVQLTANQEFTLSVGGNMYAVIENVGEFSIRFDDSNLLAKQSSGMGADFDSDYEKVVMLSTTTQSVTVVFGYGKFNDTRASVNATINTTITPSDTLDNTTDVTVSSVATLLKAADVNTKEVMINVPSDAPNAIRVGSATVTATSGLKVEPGTTIQLNCEAAVYAIRDGSSDVVVSTLKLTRP